MSNLVPSAKSGVPTINGVEFDATDILLPRVLIGQFMSKGVQDGDVKGGAIYRSTTLDTLAEPGGTTEIIPIKCFKTWINYELSGKKEEYRGETPRDMTNEHLPYEYEVDGTPWKRHKAINVYCLLPVDLEAKEDNEDDFGKVLLPSLMQFKSFSMHSGKIIATHFMNQAFRGKPPYQGTFTVSTDKTTNDKGSFYIWVVRPKPVKTKPEYMETCGNWAKMLSTTQFQVDTDGGDVKNSPAGDVNVGDIPF